MSSLTTFTCLSLKIVTWRTIWATSSPWVMSPARVKSFLTNSPLRMTADSAAFLAAAIESIKKGGAYPCLVNSANEEAVRLFLERKISFLQIGEIVSSIPDKFTYSDILSYDDVIKADLAAREYVKSIL